MAPGRPSRSRSTYSRLSPSHRPSTSRGSPLIVQLSLIARSRPSSACGGPARRARAGGRRRCRGRRRSGCAAAATSSPKRRERPRRGRAPPSQSSIARGERLGVGGHAAASGRRSRCTCRRGARPGRARARTSRRRSPSRCACRPWRTAAGPRAARTWNAAISSSGSSTLRFGPVMNSPTGTRRAPRAPTPARPRRRDAYSGGSASPAGEEEPRLPPIVPRLRICGEPTVRDAMARPGSAVAELGDRARVGHARRRRAATPSRSLPLGQLAHAREVEDRLRPRRGRSSGRPSRRCRPTAAVLPDVRRAPRAPRASPRVAAAPSPQAYGLGALV